MTVQSATAFDRLEAAAKAAGEPTYGLWHDGVKWQASMMRHQGEGSTPDEAVDDVIRSAVEYLHRMVNEWTDALAAARRHVDALRRLGHT